MNFSRELCLALNQNIEISLTPSTTEHQTKDECLKTRVRPSYLKYLP